MIDLKSVKDYIKETTDVLAIATGMEVIICDADCRVLGDSNYEKTKDVDFREDQELLSHNSIVREAIGKSQTIILMDSKETNPACRQCVNAQTCNISSIIACPIIDHGQTIGGIGLYATSESSQKLLVDQTDTLVQFVRKISDMLCGKAKETENRIAFQSMSERLRLLIESLDDAIVGFDENNNIININSKFYKIFSVPKKSVVCESHLYEALDSKEFEDFLKLCFQEKSPQKTMMQMKGKAIVLSYKPVIAENKYMGGIIYFKQSDEIYKEARNVKNNYYSNSFDDLIGSSEAFQKLKNSAKHFAKSPSTIFIQGKSGTGKEMYARAIHNASLVAGGPFVAVNCAAIPENLLESELFGHKEGAFTGSMRGGKVGKFEQANKGTLFLDEVGELPLRLQPKLLRAIQERKIQPIGSNTAVPVDIRIIAATNQNIEEMVVSGEFREDLYYRLNVIPLYVPELRERRTDIFELLDAFLEKYNTILDKNVVDFDQESKNILYHYDWPGNVRELQNVVEYAVNDCGYRYITPKNLPQRVLTGAGAAEKPLDLQPMKDIEAFYIKEALRQFGTSSAGKTAAAKALGMGRSTFYRKLSQLGFLEEEKDT